MRNRSYLGDGVYASFDGKSITLELETRGKILLDKEVWHALLDFYRTHASNFDEACAVIEIPKCVFPDITQELKELAGVAPPMGTKLQ